MKSLCRACNEIFNSMAGFDGHRVGSYGEPIYKQVGKAQRVIGHTKPERRCLTPDEMRAKGWSQNPKGWWITETRDKEGVPEEEPAQVE